MDAIPIHIDRETDHLLLVHGDYDSGKRYYKELYWGKSKDNPQSFVKEENMPNDVLRIFKKLKSEFNIQGLISSDALEQRINQKVAVPESVSEQEVRRYVDYLDAPIHDFFKRSDMMRISNGVMFSELLEEMRNGDGAFVVSSGHDYTLFPIVCSLLRHCRDDEVMRKHGQWPTYGAHIIFEVWEEEGEGITDDDKRMVRVIRDREVVPLNGKEFIEIQELEAMWRDLLASRQTL